MDGTVSAVRFYRDSNASGSLETDGTDELLATDTDGGDGWSANVDTTGYAAGTHRFFARAEDNLALLSDPVTDTADVYEPIVRWLIDDGDTYFTISSGWSTYSGVGYGNNPPDAVEECWAEWTFTVPEGYFYNVDTTWLAHSSRASAVPFELYDGTTLRANVSVNQRGTGAFEQVWEDLGSIAVMSGELRVRVTDAGASDGIVLADAVHITQGSQILVTDLAWDSVAGPPSAIAGQPFDVSRTYEVLNAPANSDILIVHKASPNETFGDGDDITLGLETLSGSADKTVGTHAGTFSATLSTPGEYYMYAQLDPAGIISEWDESNNVIVSGGQVSVLAPTPTVTIEAFDADAAEPASGGAFRVLRTGTSGALTVYLNAPGGTATAGYDYVLLPDQVVIPDGSDHVDVSVTPVLDDVAEAAETIVPGIQADSAYEIGAQASATVTLTDNPAPIAVANAYSVPEDGLLAAGLTEEYPNGVLGNDSDPDDEALTAVLVTAPDHGQVELHADGTFRYTPDPNFAGQDGFPYQADDGSARSTVTSVAITVTPADDAPGASEDYYATQEDTALIVAAAWGLLANDVEHDGQAMQALHDESVDTPPEHGSVSVNTDGTFTYTPEADFHGLDTFTYRASDGTLQSEPVLVTVDVQSVSDEVIANRTPFALGEWYAVAADGSLSVPVPGVLANDTDADEQVLEAALVAGEAVDHGVLSLGLDGAFTYTPTSGYEGVDSFQYQASDGTAVSDAATVSLYVGIPSGVSGEVAPSEWYGLDDASVTRLAKGSDDKIVIVGTSGDEAGRTDFLVQRHTSDGTLDPIGGEDALGVDFGAEVELAKAVLAVSDGGGIDMVTVGQVRGTDGTWRVALARMNADGTFHTGFGDVPSGETDPDGAGRVTIGIDGQDLWAYDLAALWNAYVLIAGAAESDTGEFLGRYGTLATLETSTNSASEPVLVLTEADGSRWAFHKPDDSLPAPQQGAFDTYAGPEGGEVRAEYYMERHGGNLKRIVRGDEPGEHEEFLYSYHTEGEFEGRLASVTLRRNDSRTAHSRAVYEYYTSADAANPHDPKGAAGDLKRVTIYRWETVPGGTSQEVAVARTLYQWYPAKAGVEGSRSRLRAVLGPDGYDRLTGDGMAVNTTTVAKYADIVINAYDSEGRVDQQTLLGTGDDESGSCTTADTFHYDYARNAGAPLGFNVWQDRTVVTRDASPVTTTTYTNFAGQVMLTDVHDPTSGPGQESDLHWYTFARYDNAGRVLLAADTDAVRGIKPDAGQTGVPVADDLLGWTGNQYEYLYDNTGFVTYYDYWDALDAGFVTGSEGYLREISIAHGELAPGQGGIKQQTLTYEAVPGSDNSLFVVATDTSYTGTDGTGAITVTYDYPDMALDWYGAQPSWITTILPAVSVEHNGSGTTAQTTEYFDQLGRTTSFTDETGLTTSIAYDGPFGLDVTQTVSGGSLSQSTTTWYDAYGRPQFVEDAAGRIATYQYIHDPADGAVTVSVMYLNADLPVQYVRTEPQTGWTDCGTASAGRSAPRKARAV